MSSQVHGDYKVTQRLLFRHTVWPWRGVKVWLHAIKTRGSLSQTCFCPIESKLHMEDNSPGLMTSTQKSLLKMTAPPAGYRKWHVVHFDELLLAALQYTAQMSSVKSLDHGHYFDISSNRVNLEVRRRIILRQRTRCYHNSTVHCAVPAKLLSKWSESKPETALCVNISPQCHSATYWFAMKQEVLCKSTRHYPNDSKLLTYDHNPHLNSIIC